MCFTDTQLASLMKKRQSTVKFRYPVFAGLPLLHYGGLTVFGHLLSRMDMCSPYIALGTIDSQAVNVALLAQWLKSQLIALFPS